MTDFRPARYPDDVRLSDDFKLEVAGQAVPVLAMDSASFAPLELAGRAEAVVETSFDFARCVVRPLNRGVTPVVKGRRVVFELPDPAGRSVHLSVEFHGADGALMLHRPLFVLVSPPIAEPSGSGVRTFEPGRVHEVGTLRLASGQTLYLPAGAVVRGHLRAEKANDIAVVGGGVWDASRTEHRVRHPDRKRLMVLADCRDVRLEGFTVVDSPSWTVVPVGCAGVDIREVKLVNDAANDDGFDIVGSRDVRLDRCFARTRDDCVAVKATGKGAENPDEPSTACGMSDVEHVRVTGGTFWNAEWGNALEIGYETRCETMRDIVFEDCDIIRSEPERWTSGGVLTIHNGDRAHVRDVVYRDIRVEDAGHKLVDFKISFDQYSRDEVRGFVSDILIDGLHVVDGPMPPSILQGTGVGGENRLVENVTIRNLTYRDEPLTDAMSARFITERAKDVRFED
jgi:hypothetical protein